MVSSSVKKKFPRSQGGNLICIFFTDKKAKWQQSLCIYPFIFTNYYKYLIGVNEY